MTEKTNLDFYRFTFLRYFDQPETDAIVKHFIAPFLVDFEQACLKPFFPTYSTQRLNKENVGNAAIEAAFLYLFNKIKFTDEERFMCIKFINRHVSIANQKCRKKIQDFVYLLLSSDEKMLVNAHDHTNIFITMKQFLRERPTFLQSDDEFMSVCFNDFKRSNYTVNECVLPVQLHATRKHVCFTGERLLFDTECVREHDVYDSRLVERNLLGRCDLKKEKSLVAIDLRVVDKEIDPLNKYFRYPSYTAKLQGSGYTYYYSDSNIDQFLFELSARDLKNRLLNRAKMLSTLMYRLCKRKNIRDCIISYVLLFEHRYSSITLWSCAPVIFREISLSNNVLSWPIMMPFNQRGLFCAEKLDFCADFTKNAFFVREIYREKQHRKSLNIAIDAFGHERKELLKCSSEVPFLNFKLINNLTRTERFCETKYRFDSSDNIVNCFLIRSDRAIRNIQIVIGNYKKIFEADYTQTIVKKEKDGTEWHSCSICKLTSNFDALITNKGSNLCIDALQDFGVFDYVDIIIQWKEEILLTPDNLLFYLRCFNIMYEENGVCAPLYG